MLQSGFVDICEIAGQHLGIERGACRDFSGKAVAVWAGSVAVLVGRDLCIPQQLEEKGRIDAAMAVEIAIMVEHTLPRVNGREMRRLQCRDLPLFDREI